MNPVYRVTEYGSFITGKTMPGYITLPPHTFQQLEEFILSNQTLELMQLSARRGVGKVITAKNHVGILTLRDGTTIEILPKIYAADDDGRSAKALLVQMLKTLRGSPFKALRAGNVDNEKLNIFEIFIRMFVEEVFFIVKRGLKRSYETVEENAAFFRGKLQFSKQLRLNCIHKERSYVHYDAFTVNRPENRLIKATLLYLYQHSASSKNKKDIKILLNAFAEADASTNYPADFARYVPERNMKDYSTALLWCSVFLSGRSFTSFAGSQVALALLFPMETLFESYIAALLKKELSGTEYAVSVQDRSHHLFDTPGKQFQLRPDIVVRRKADGAVFVLDTKWKILAQSKTNFGITQADMYQMYAYQKKYGAEAVTLVYPRTDSLSNHRNIRYESQDNVSVHVRFVDFQDIPGSIRALMPIVGV